MNPSDMADEQLSELFVEALREGVDPDPTLLEEMNKRGLLAHA